MEGGGGVEGGGGEGGGGIIGGGGGGVGLGGGHQQQQHRANARRRACRTCGQQHATHEPHVYDYVDEVDEDVTCHICLQPLVTPLDTPCGHTFCRPCLLSFLKVQQLCPVDRKPLSQQLCSPSSLVLKKLLEKLRVQCPNTDQCAQTMQRGDLEDHLKYRCPGNWVSCPNAAVGCDFRGTQRAIASHVPACALKDVGLARPPVLEGQISHVDIPRTSTSVGLAIVGGTDTPLRCVVIQEVFPDGVVAQDGRLQPGDQIIEVNGVDMTSATHHQVCQALRHSTGVLRLGVYRERIEAYRTMSPQNANSGQGLGIGETISVTLTKETGRQLGIKLGGRRTEPGIFIMEVLDASVASLDGRLHAHDRILAINGADVRYARLDHASRLIQQSLSHVTLVVSRGGGSDSSAHAEAAASGAHDAGSTSLREYSHLFRRPHPSMPVAHARTKSAPDTLLLARNDPAGRNLNNSLGDVTDGRNDIDKSGSYVRPCDSSADVNSGGGRGGGGGGGGRSASCESLSDRSPSILSSAGLQRSVNGSLASSQRLGPHSSSLGSLDGFNYASNGSLASVGSHLQKSSGSLSSMRMIQPILDLEKTKEVDGTTPPLPPRYDIHQQQQQQQQFQHRSSCHDLLDSTTKDKPQMLPVSPHVAREELDPLPPHLPLSSQSQTGHMHSMVGVGGPQQGDEGLDVLDGSVLSTGGGEAVPNTETPPPPPPPPPPSSSHRSKSRRSRESRSDSRSDIQDLALGLRRALRIEGAQCHQKTVTISKAANESLGMRIGGGVASNEGDTPIYIANINPQGPVGRAKQVKKGDVLLSVNGQSLLGLTHGQAVALLKATAELGGVTLSVLEGPETCVGACNFVPSWLYWQKLPRSLHISKSVVLHRAPGASLGFSIVGGSDPQRGPEPIHVLFVVQSSPAALDGKLRCGDRLLAVDGHSLESVRHSSAVNLLKQAGHRVHLEVVSWLGTEV
ncbi:ligand of Numb protein X 2-like [Oratosquilla oratoria]|uniref:ligand of Numb protein X 2-like n=1 Tax=Oratosquilla oratoria TaxID=337810 RepID=UPI003F7592C4